MHFTLLLLYHSVFRYVADFFFLNSYIGKYVFLRSGIQTAKRRFWIGYSPHPVDIKIKKQMLLAYHNQKTASIGLYEGKPPT